MVRDRGKQSKDKSLFFKYVNKISDMVAALTTAGIFIIVMVQIIGRLIGYPAPWTEEMTRFIFIWMIFLGIGIGFREAESARVTVLTNRLPKVMQKGAVWVYSIGTIAFFLFMLFAGIELMKQQMMMNEMSSVLLIPMWLIGISVPLSGVLGIVNTLQSLIYHRDLI